MYREIGSICMKSEIFKVHEETEKGKQICTKKTGLLCIKTQMSQTRHYMQCIALYIGLHQRINIREKKN